MEESQPQPKAHASYFDPEGLDTSEEQFSASLEANFERPQFIVDIPVEGQAAPPQPAELSAPHVESDSILCHASQAGPESQSAADPDQEKHDWRNQVSAKVNRYKARRPQRDRYPSLRLPFDLEPRERRTASFVADFASALEESEVAEKPAPEHYQPIVLESAARVLEFPRMVPPVHSDELAEPVHDRPRIVEAPELVPPPPALGGILIEPLRQPEPERRPGIDFPLQSSSISRRLCAAVLDGIVVSVAFTAFAYIFVGINGATPPARLTAEMSVALLAILWFTYQYAFLVYSGTTPGLRLTRLKVSRFDGGDASRSLRRWRTLASCLSGLSLGLGYTWCWLDEDQLCWHDRITRTHLSRR